MGGNQSVPRVTAQDRAILDLKHQRDKLRQYQKQIQAVLDREQQVAKECLAHGQKDRALVALRRRKYQEGLLLKTDGQLENLQSLVSTIEFSLVQASVLEGLKQGNNVLKQLQKEMSLERVEQIMEDTHDAREYQRELNGLLSENLTRDDEDEVQRELEAMQAEARAEIEEPERNVKLPDAPSGEIILPEKEEAVPQKERDRTRVAIPA